MDSVKKKTRQRRISPLKWLMALWLVLLVIVGARSVVLQVKTTAVPQAASTIVTVLERAPSGIVSITMKRGSDPIWTAHQLEKGILTVQGEDGFTLTDADSASLLEAVSRIEAESVLSDAPSEYANLADFGLDNPRYILTAEYADGTSAQVSIGMAGPEGGWRYMLLEGDERLFAVSMGTVDALFPNRDTLRQVTQPVLHKARIDQITLSGPDGVQAQWTLTGDITDADAIDRWAITAPISYPADSSAMGNLLSNIANLHLAAYQCEATPENLTRCGFDTPRLTIDIHMAAGTIGNVNSEGAYETADWPAGTLTYVIGGEKSDLVDYVLHNGAIYISSHLTIGVFIDYDVAPTMSRYLVPTALGNLARLRIEQGDAITEYEITRTEQVAENNELVTNADGSIVYDISLTKNGEIADYAAFEAAYSALLPVTVSGKLPSTVDAAPHTVYTFTDIDGTVHTVAFAAFDAMHDAVSIDGHQAFYLIKGGFTFGQ